MQPNAIVYLPLSAARVFLDDPTLEGNEPFRYEVFIQRIEPDYVVLRVGRGAGGGGFNVLYLPWEQIWGLEMAEGVSHELIRRHQ